LVLAVLCALPAVTPSVSDARPYNWDEDPIDPNNPTNPPKGDGDGTVVKARYVGDTSIDAARVGTTVTQPRTWSVWRTYLSLVRWGFGLRWGAF
jgi:hypothetical protein